MSNHESLEVPVRPTAKVILFADNRIVTVTGKSGLMNLPGGGIDATDKNAETALMRELDEELGIGRAHIRNLEMQGTISGQTKGSMISSWDVFAAELTIPVIELAPDYHEIVIYGDYSRSELLRRDNISNLARHAIISFT